MSDAAAAIVLAAGLGRRFGGSKMLAAIDGRPMLQLVLDNAAAAGLRPVIVVLGTDADAVERAIAWRSEVRIRNPAPQSGLASSLRLGLAEVERAERAVVLLGDQPFVTADRIRVITAAPRDPARPIVVPRYGSQPGNPVLLEREAWSLGWQVAGDRGMSQLFAAHPELVRYVDVAGSNADVDTPRDLARAQARATVASGYDLLADRFAQWASAVQDPERERFLDEFRARLPARADVLDLGCGTAAAWTGSRAEGIALTGVDVSASQLAAARSNVPGARLINADMSDIGFPSNTFDGVIALYSLIHVPREEHAILLRRIEGWLRPGGLFLAALSATDSTDWTGEWQGVEMFFSGFDDATNRKLLLDSGFQPVVDETVEVREPDGPVRFQWVLSRVSRV